MKNSHSSFLFRYLIENFVGFSLDLSMDLERKGSDYLNGFHEISAN